MARIAWAMTGAGHFLKESADLMGRLKAEGHTIDLFVSEAGMEVMEVYRIKPPVTPRGDRSASTLACREFYAGTYGLLVVSPATANSVAKMALGISDSLITTLFAQAGKAEVRTIVLPTDTEENIDTMGATKPVTVKPRPVDLENVHKLGEFPGVTVALNPRALENAVRSRISDVR